jgi:hypothetical protein
MAFELSGKLPAKKEATATDMLATTNMFESLISEIADSFVEELWEVVQDSVPVWAGKDMNISNQLGSRFKCDIVLGWMEESDWVRLDGGGYIRMKDAADPEQTPMRMFRVSYTKIRSGACLEEGMYPITDSSMCELAAAELGSARGPAQLASGAPLPEGCYVSSGAELWLVPSEHTDRRWGPAPAMRETLCSSHEPCHMTTVTTSTHSTQTRTSVSSVSTTTTATRVTTTTEEPPSLFCFSVIRVTKQSTEPDLLEAQYEKGASIFSCDAYTVLSNGGSIYLAGRPTPEIDVSTVKLGHLGDKGVTTDSWVNTAIFMEAWNMLDADGVFRTCDWTVKVDPDAVFFPRRLAPRLTPHTESGGNGYFVNNCGAFVEFGWSEFYGSLEVFSQVAVEKYLVKANQHRCRTELEWDGWGEDLFISQCMVMLGVDHIDLFDMLGDKRCVAAPCTDTTKVAFHDFKDSASWFDCWRQSGGLPQPVMPLQVASI